MPQIKTLVLESKNLTTAVLHQIIAEQWEVNDPQYILLTKLVDDQPSTQPVVQQSPGPSLVSNSSIIDGEVVSQNPV